MTFDKNIAEQVAKYLLEKKAVLLRPEEPFTWASGWKSPIYCDNRLLLSYPDVRTYIKDAMSRIVDEVCKPVDTIVGVATAGISHAALIADKLNLPMAYGRTKEKDHGRQNVIEGKVEENTRVVVVEDLISTAGSSLNIVHTLRDIPTEVVALVAIFSYGFPVADERMNELELAHYTLSDYNTLVDEALKMNFISEKDVNLLKEWRKNPSEWGI